MKSSPSVCIRGHVGQRNAYGACKRCAADNAKKYRQANPEKFRARDAARYNTPEKQDEYCARARAYHERNRTQNLRRMRNWYQNNKDKVRARNKTYNRKPLTREQHRRRHGMPEPTRPEPTLCECCGKHPGKRGIHLDHCHKTGKFRGWLCVNCNTGIGKLGDSIEGLLTAIAYLSR